MSIIIFRAFKNRILNMTYIIIMNTSCPAHVIKKMYVSMIMSLNNINSVAILC